MKLIILVALALVALAVADPPEPPKILRSEFDQTVDGYAFRYETENGISRDEQGEVKDILDEENKPHRVVISRGSYSYTNADGKNEFVAYYADETGYHAEGDSIPKV